MPNWTQNKVTVTGKPERLDAFKQIVKSKKSDFDFNNIIPMPKELLNTHSTTHIVPTQEEADAKNKEDGLLKRNEVRYISQEEANRRQQLYGHDVLNWYEWANKYWGTKWDAQDVQVVEDGDSLIYGFLTAWDAPRNIIRLVKAYAKSLDIKITWEADHEDGGYESILE